MGAQLSHCPIYVQLTYYFPLVFYWLQSLSDVKTFLSYLLRDIVGAGPYQIFS